MGPFLHTHGPSHETCQNHLAALTYVDDRVPPAESDSVGLERNLRTGLANELLQWGSLGPCSELPWRAVTVGNTKVR